MGMKDTETKRYISNPDIFADAFNYLLYNGKQVITPSSLKPVDTTGIAVPYGNGAKTPIQKYRDNMKIWAAMYDGRVVYVLLGSENQSNIHYAMPPKNMLYDSINYAAQVDAARASYKGFKFDEDRVKIAYTSAEFLSGFRKGDKLIPVITAVIYFGKETWDAPRSIHEMLDVDPALLPFIPDYKINLIAPAEIDDSAFSTKEHEGKFHTGFGTLMQVIKHQEKEEVADIIMKAPIVDPTSADMIEDIANVKFERVYTENGGVNMCKGMETYVLKKEVLATIETAQALGKTHEEAIQFAMQKYELSEETIKQMLMPKAV